MKNVKNIYRMGVVSMAAVALLFTSSCEKYLEVENPSNLTQDDVFGSVSYTGSAITGIYNRLMGDDGYGSRLAIIYPQSADDFKTSGSYSPLDRRGISEYGVAPQNTELNNPFRQLYEGIERANICIKFIPLSEPFNNGSESEKAQMRKFLGEALALRAWFFHEVIRNWGDVPASFIPSADQPDLYLEKTDRDEIYDQILADLEQAITLLPWQTESNDPPTRITKAAAKGIRARIALARGGYSLRRDTRKMERRSDYQQYYEIARQECLDIIEKGDNGLNASFENVFKSLHGQSSLDASREMVFKVGAYGGNARTDSKLGYGNGLRQNTSSSWGYANGGVRAIPTYFYEFGIGDTRRDVTLGLFEINAQDNKQVMTSVNMTDAKFRRYWTNSHDQSQSLGIDWPLLRYSDILLLFAEADNELNGGPSAQAIQALKDVRVRAYGGDEANVGTIPADKEGFFDVIVKERLLEFGGEGIRKYDLLRWNLLETVLDNTRIKLREFRLGEGIYEQVPNRIFYKLTPFINSSAGGEVADIDFAGGALDEIFFKPTPGGDRAAPPEGYTSINWREAVTNGYIFGVNDSGAPDGSGYALHFKSGQSELLPIYSEIVSENYRLDQDYGY
ncbi:RagB/SusD family nutrient uptake outer membrane protein [Sphingobacterium phlebotomi]|uniref:RagB/SusD family nutrient uptake outer membrane protein n=1 Tax=Sphingobacterium phlebotomi TaxID=2605433 RepID=A0A5D4H9H3_9SPHI|nr:RagB/SusD family nutrient uptake outer membrane protein [Sphingobacterium phlebotomi]TYR37254.1 RagB/SusD family nutrient uptake outer membrane protein [Sphingobacterium phlebotomi]